MEREAIIIILHDIINKIRKNDEDDYTKCDIASNLNELINDL